jgi:transcriptional regulator with PAS, ATPase and Fis domain
VKDTEVPVLVLGESGTGKELVARAIHSESARHAEPFVSENCAAIPEPLLESTLFGHEPGAFTGAESRRAGIFELAGGGTIFLDEVGELTSAAQAKLLRVLQERRVRRLGGSEEVPLRARVVAATNRDLAAMVREGRFREDLYYRLNVVSLRVPALRERRDDIPALLEALCRRHGVAVPGFAPEALRALLNHSWPGNVRELDNEVRRLHALTRDRVALEDLSPEVLGKAAQFTRPDEAPLTFKAAERRTLVAALRAARGQRVKAAEILAIPHGTLWHKLKKHRIEASEYS